MVNYGENIIWSEFPFKIGWKDDIFTDYFIYSIL